MTNASSGRIKELIDAYLGVDDNTLLGDSGSTDSDNNIITGTYFMNDKSDYDYTAYRNGKSRPTKLTDENGKWNNDFDKGYTTQQNNRNGGKGDEKPPSVINGNKDGINPGGYINYNGAFNTDKIANKKFISIIAISPGGGAGGSGRQKAISVGGGGGGSGIGFIGDITLFKGITITDCDVQVGGGGVGGNSGSKQNNKASFGNSGFIGGNTVINITLSDDTNISIDLFSGKPGSPGGYIKTSGSTYDYTDIGKDGDAGHIELSIRNTKQLSVVVPEFINNVSQYTDALGNYAFTFTKYPGNGGKSGAGGQITNDFYNQLGYYKDMKNADGKTIAQVVNSDLNYSFQNRDLTIYDIKLGSGGLGEGLSSETAYNATSGRAGFVSLFTYDSKPDYYPDVIGESPDMNNFIPVDIEINVSEKKDANTIGPLWLEVYSEDKTIPQVIYGNNNEYINGFKYYLNVGGKFEKGSLNKDVFYVNKNLKNFYVKLSTNTTDRIDISKLTITAGVHSKAFDQVSNETSGNKSNGFYGKDEDTVGLLELDDNTPSVRWFKVNRE